MDLNKILRELYAKREQVVQKIAALEEMRGTGGGAMPKQASKHRDRKFMSTEERQQVSERMRRYWASRRKPEHQG